MDFIVRPIEQKWFPETIPVNYVKGLTATIGSGENGTITIVDNIATSLKIEVVVAETASANLSAVCVADVITVTLGTDVSSVADNTKNTATLIAGVINGIKDKTWSATASGTGATPITAAIAKKTFTTFTVSGTPCPEAGICLYDRTNSKYYVCVDANNTTYNNGWRSFSLTDY